jgi:hypothetical protein
MSRKHENFDIHAQAPMDPQNYDVLITDVNDITLHHDIAREAGIPYLSEAIPEQRVRKPRIMKGFIYGRLHRMILPCVVEVEDKAVWVFFIVNTGAPITYISKQVRFRPTLIGSLAINSTLDRKSSRLLRGHGSVVCGRRGLYSLSAYVATKTTFRRCEYSRVGLHYRNEYVALEGAAIKKYDLLFRFFLERYGA